MRAFTHLYESSALIVDECTLWSSDEFANKPVIVRAFVCVCVWRKVGAGSTVFVNK